MTKKQLELFDAEAYPKGLFKPLHPLFKGKASVERHSFPSSEEPFTVNLTTGECSCQHGAAWAWYSDAKTPGKWVGNRYCVHKLKAMADIVQRVGPDDDPGLFFAFTKAVATRYNQYEVVSTFHKHLRRGDVERSFFFGCILATTRRAKGIIKYLLAIVYEETRDHDLRKYLSTFMEQPDQLTFLDMAKAITWFCQTPKKWDLHEHRIKLYEHEMRGYQRLIKEFGNDVAKASEIIDSDMVPVFLKLIPKAIKSGDYDLLQYAVKGIQKSKFPDGVADLHDLRLLAVSALYKAASGKFKAPPAVTRFYKYLQAKPETIGISYHDLNAFADLISGEPYSYGILASDKQAAIQRLKKLPVFPFDKYPAIPLYAQDNHTWRGKALLRKYAGQIPYGTEQTHIDLRGCGAYIGVGWRYYATAQFGGINKAAWDEVKIPIWIRNLTMNLFY